MPGTRAVIRAIPWSVRRTVTCRSRFAAWWRGGTGRVEGVEDPRRLVAPLLRPAPFELGEPGGEDRIDLSTLLRGRRAQD